jgi:hypothetical protein
MAGGASDRLGDPFVQAAAEPLSFQPMPLCAKRDLQVLRGLCCSRDLAGEDDSAYERAKPIVTLESKPVQLAVWPCELGGCRSKRGQLEHPARP